MPVYKLLGGPTRDRIRIYKGGARPENIKQFVEMGFTAFKTGVARDRPARIVESKDFVDKAAAHFAALREAAGPEVDIAIDFHGAISPQTAKLLINALEPYQPMFIEEPVRCQNIDVLADLAQGTHIPITATGERLFTKWGFREVLEKRAAMVLQPDLPPAGFRGTSSRAWPRPTMQPLRLTAPWGPSRSRLHSSSTQRSPTSSHRNTQRLARGTSRSLSRSETATSTCRPSPAWVFELDESPCRQDRPG